MSAFGKHTVIAAFERMKIILHLHTEGDVAEYLGLTKQTMSNWKHRGSLDIALIKEKIPGISIDWLLTGEGVPKRETQKEASIISDVDNLVKKLNETILHGSKRVSEAGVEYGTRDGSIVERASGERIPYYYSSVSGGERTEHFNELKGYWQMHYLVNERTLAVEMRDDDYGSVGLERGDFVIIDTARKPSGGDVVLAKMVKYLDLLEYSEVGDKVFLNEVSEKTNKNSFEFGKNFDILGVLIATIKYKK